jgi:hypothetical protein
VFRVYSCHLKAGSTSSDQATRLSEATVLRNELNALPDGSNLILCGDLNIQSSSEAAYQMMVGSLADDSGRLFDPIATPGTWHNNAGLAWVHTQSPRILQFGGGANGGMDDRFDQILVSSGVLDDDGFDFIEGSYTSYGNDGLHYNTAIIDGPNLAVGDSIALAIHDASDHLPVYADFDFPASGLTTASAPVAPGAGLAVALEPNPFNPAVTVSYTVPAGGAAVSVTVHDLRGRLVSEVAAGWAEAGEHQSVWRGVDDRGRPAASGVYLVRVSAGDATAVAKAVLLR